MKLLPILCTAAFIAATASATAQSVVVEANFDTRHKVGDVDQFDRPKFINFHGTITENYWDRGNASNTLRDDLLVKYDVYVGRDTGGLRSTLNTLKEDPERPGFADPAHIAALGKKKRESYASKPLFHQYEKYNYMVLCNQFHEFYPNGKKTRQGWALSTNDTESEPYGSASGEFYGRYIKESFGQGGTTGEPQPKYIEIINEPMWDIWDMPKAPKTSLEQLYKFHTTVAREVKKYNPHLPVGGYVTAFPDFDVDNFDRWNKRWKSFIDVAGEDMDFWSIHLYDFPCFGKKSKYRKGSNMEATMDMLEQYSYMKLGVVKPILISEYNAQTHNYNRQKWSPYRDWLKLKSANSMVLQFMERANNIVNAMPFIMLRSDWGYNKETGLAHGARMLRRENEPESFTGDYVFSEAIKFYQQWKDVKGTRVETSSSNPDIMCDGYVDGKSAYLIINNLEFKPIELDLQVNGMAKGAKSIEVRYLHLEGGEGGVPKLDITKVSALDKLTIDAEATYVIRFNYSKPVRINKLVEETKYYATTYLKPITANKSLTFEVNGIKKGTSGEAILRLGMGRNHGKSLQPTLLVNGKSIPVPSNYRGDTQDDRDNYFGVVEIPVDYDAIKENNKITVTFPDDGGHVSSAIMQMFVNK